MATLTFRIRNRSASYGKAIANNSNYRGSSVRTATKLEIQRDLIVRDSSAKPVHAPEYFHPTVPVEDQVLVIGHNRQRLAGISPRGQQVLLPRTSTIWRGGDRQTFKRGCSGTQIKFATAVIYAESDGTLTHILWAISSSVRASLPHLRGVDATTLGTLHCIFESKWYKIANTNDICVTSRQFPLYSRLNFSLDKIYSANEESSFWGTTFMGTLLVFRTGTRISRIN